MKRLATTLLLILFSISVQAQRTIIVDNTGIEAEGDHIFTDLQTAINTAQSGDIIHIIHSPNSYGDITINSKSNLTFVGIGYYPDIQIPSARYNSEIGEVNIFQSSNLTFRGLYSQNGGTGEGFQIENTTDNTSSTDIFIEECLFRDIYTGSGANRIVISNSYIYQYIDLTGSNHTVRNSIIRDQSPVVNRTDFENNLIANFSNFTGAANDFTNNIFLYTGSSDPLSNEGWSFVNNFFNRDAGHSVGNFDQDNIIGNLAYSQIFEQDIPDLSTWSGYNELTLKSTLLINAGNDGTDIGPTGGSSPHSRSLLSLPSIIELITPTKVQEGQDFEVILRAKSN